jgi:anthranilate phosphoribosyltransferase
MSKSFEEARAKFEHLFANQMGEDEAREFLVDLYKKGESADEIAAAVDVMREYSIKLDLNSDLIDKLIDIVGTGGDKSGSFNISSTVSLLLASVGSFVAKHGNRSITSKSGSADMLEMLGINLNLDTKKQATMLQECGFCFLFAQNHHPAMKHIMPIRKSLDHRTIFNILGPLTNPAGVKRYLIGVFDRDFLGRIIEALSMLDTKSAVAVSSQDGMDEISISTVTDSIWLKDGKTKEMQIDPVSFGLKHYPKSEILGADAKTNAKITKDILENIDKGAKRDIVLLNAGVALVVEEIARDIKEGIEIARDAIESGKAKAKLKEIIKVSNSL